LKAKFLFIPFLLLLLTPVTQGQRLVLNGDFDDVNRCTELSQPCSPSAWFYINRNPLGYHNRMLSFGQFGDSVYQYWQTMLLDKLIAGKEYILRCDVGGDAASFAGYGFWFTDSFLYAACDTQLSPKQYIPVEGVHMEKKFRAGESVQYLVIGRFGKVENAPGGFTLNNLQITPVKKYRLTGTSIKDSLYQLKRRHDHLPGCNKTTDTPVNTIIRVDSFALEDLSFAVDQSTILDPDVIEKYREQLDNSTIRQVMITGYADSTGSLSYNQELSQRRAEAVKKLLVDRYGIPADRISTSGKGVSTRYAENHRNRRVEILVYRRGP
jgi:outer membrane protein OmpA-like peptidoglycan-associated protein